MRSTFDRRLWILLFIILIQCITNTNQQNIKPQNPNSHQHKPADAASAWSISNQKPLAEEESFIEESFLRSTDDNKYAANRLQIQDPQQQKQKEKLKGNTEKCAKNCLGARKISSKTAHSLHSTAIADIPFISKSAQLKQSVTHRTNFNSNSKKPTQLPSKVDPSNAQPQKILGPAKTKQTKSAKIFPQWHQNVHIAHRYQHKEVKAHREVGRVHENDKLKSRGLKAISARHHAASFTNRLRREIVTQHRLSSFELNNESISNDEDRSYENRKGIRATMATSARATGNVFLHKTPTKAVDESRLATSMEELSYIATPAQEPLDEHLLQTLYFNESTGNAANDLEAIAQYSSYDTTATKIKHTRSTVTMPATEKLSHKSHGPIIIIDDVEEFDSGTDRDDKSEDYSRDEQMEPRVLPLRPILPNPFEDEEMSVKYAEQHSEIRLMCEVDLDIAASMWYKNGQVVHAMDRTTRVTDYRFIKEANGALTITNVMLEDDGKWQCEAENTRRYSENARPVKLVVLDRPKPPYLLIDSRRLDAGNIFVPVKENSELNLACISEGGNPKPTLTWEVLLSPGVDRHAQKVSAEVLELEEVKSEKDKNAYKINGGSKSEARLPAVYRAHHNARILCVMEHPTLKIRQNASLLLDVQYTPSFAISRTPGFGYPLREGIEVSLKCDVDSNPPSTPRWQKDDGDTPVPQIGDGFLNFTSIRREHSGWYKCTSRHLNFQYSSIGYYLSVRYDSVDVTSEPDDQDVSVAAASHNPNKGQLEVQLGGAVTLQCPQGSLGCWSHLDPVTARLRGLGYGLSTPTGQFSLKDVVYQDAGTYKCIGQSATNKKKLEVLQTVGVSVKGAPTVVARNATPVAYPGSPLHLAVEFCANPPAHAARWLHGDRVFTPGNQYGSTVLAYGVTDLPTPYCKEARLTYVSMHERVPRIFYFIVSTPGGVAEAIFRVNFTMRFRTVSNAVDDEEEELSEPEEIHFPVFGSTASSVVRSCAAPPLILCLLLWVCKCG